MRKALTMCVVIVIVALLPNSFSTHYISKAEAPTIPAKEIKDYSVVEMIEYYSDIYDQDPLLLKKVAECESEYETNLLGDGGRAYSVYQFHKSTFDRWSKEFGEPLDYKSYHDNIKLAVWSFSQGERYRNAWTTYVAIKKGGKYSFYSKLLKNNYTVVCKL
jgi:hypothetical protein